MLKEMITRIEGANSMFDPPQTIECYWFLALFTIAAIFGDKYVAKNPTVMADFLDILASKAKDSYEAKGVRMMAQSIRDRNSL